MVRPVWTVDGWVQLYTLSRVRVEESVQSLCRFVDCQVLHFTCRRSDQLWWELGSTKASPFRPDSQSAGGSGKGSAEVTWGLVLYADDVVILPLSNEDLQLSLSMFTCTLD